MMGMTGRKSMVDGKEVNMMEGSESALGENGKAVRVYWEEVGVFWEEVRVHWEEVGYSGRT